MTKIHWIYAALLLAFFTCTASGPGCDCNAHAQGNRAVTTVK
jgi:hypothetical protein